MRSWSTLLTGLLCYGWISDEYKWQGWGYNCSLLHNCPWASKAQVQLGGGQVPDVSQAQPISEQIGTGLPYHSWLIKSTLYTGHLLSICVKVCFHCLYFYTDYDTDIRFHLCSLSNPKHTKTAFSCCIFCTLEYFMPL